MNEFEDKYLHELEPWAAGDEKYQPLYNELINLALAHTKKKAVACDVACGTGWFTKKIAEKYANVFGIDVSETAIRRAKSINAADNIVYEAINAFDYMFNEQNWDVIFINELMYYYKPYENERLLGKIAKCLCEDGILIVSVKDMSETLLNDIELALAQDFNLIENTFYDGHNIYVLHKKNKRKYCFITYDWELSERSTVEEDISEQRVEAELVTPVLDLLNLHANNVGVTYFVEINQLYFLNKYYGRLSLAIDRLKAAAKKGRVSIGLHVHPNWDVENNANIRRNHVKYGKQGYGYLSGKEAEIVGRWISMFKELFGFCPNVFRSGKYRPLSDELRAHLIKQGVKVFSTELSDGLVVSDNGEVFNYSENLGKRAVQINTYQNKLVYDILINSGSLLTLDCSNDIFRQKLSSFTPRELLTFVSHPKDINNVVEHAKNISDIEKIIMPLQFSRLDIWKVIGDQEILFENYLDSSVLLWVDHVNRHYDLSSVQSENINLEFLNWIRKKAKEDPYYGKQLKKVDHVEIYKFCFIAVSIFVSNSSREIVRVDFLTRQFVAVAKFIARRMLFALPENLISTVRSIRVKAAVMSAVDSKYKYHMLIA